MIDLHEFDLQRKKLRSRITFTTSAEEFHEIYKEIVELEARILYIHAGRDRIRNNKEQVKAFFHRANQACVVIDLGTKPYRWPTRLIVDRPVGERLKWYAHLQYNPMDPSDYI